MQNVEIARHFDDVADLLEIQGANPFRVRAYRNAARTIADHSVQLRKLVAEGADLTELPTIGKDIAGYVEELVRTGSSSIYRELTATVPASLVELTRIPGLGAKRVKKLWEELGIETLDQLEAAARAGRIEELEGFGKKTQQQILDRVAARRRQAARVKLADADQLIEPLVEYLQQHRAVKQLEVAGSYRRRLETVGDIDLLAIATTPEFVMRRFTEYQDVAEVQRAGDTRGTVILKSGLQVDLRVVPPESYGAALQYFTGSKAHNVKFRTWAVQRGLRVSEYGVFEGGERGEEGRRLAGRTEEEVYAALDLPWIPPELREDRGELEAARDGKLPELITVSDIRGDLQMHTTWSDGRNSIEEMLDGCLARGYEYFAITDHSKALAMTGGLDAKKLRRQWREMDELVERRADAAIRLLRGMEVDILPDGSLDLEDELLERLDVVLVSVHSKLDLPAARQTKRIVKALEHPATDILAHPTGRLINRREPMAFDLEEVFQCAKEHGVIVELNAHPDRLDLRDADVIRAKEVGLKMAIGTDAHRVADLGLMRYGVDQARRAWLGRRDVVNAWPLEKLLAWLDRG